MLIELRGENFGCFREPFALSLRATDIDPGDPRGLLSAEIEGDPEPLMLLRAAAIYGPNASGKSTVLRAAIALNALIETSAGQPSDEPLAPFEPFMLDEKGRKRAVKLGVSAVINKRVYEYDISFTSTQFVSEELREITADSETVLIDRRKGEPIGGEWAKDKSFGLFTRDHRDNALILSLADAFAPRLAADLAVSLRRLLMYGDPIAYAEQPFEDRSVPKRLHADPGFADWLRSSLRHADIGVVDHELTTVTLPVQGRPGPDNRPADAPAPTRKRHRLRLMHAGESGPVVLTYDRESSGTQRFIELSPMFYDLSHADAQRAVFVDELDASLHPTLLSELLRAFNSDLPKEKVRGQLVFASHATELFEGDARSAVLRRDQVYFTEKDSGGAARLYSLAEFKERNNLNLRKRYLEGRYGALPVLGDLGG